MSNDLAEQAKVFAGQLLSRYLRHAGLRSSDFFRVVLVVSFEEVREASNVAKPGSCR